MKLSIGEKLGMIANTHGAFTSKQRGKAVAEVLIETQRLQSQLNVAIEALEQLKGLCREVWIEHAEPDMRFYNECTFSNQRRKPWSKR